MCVCAYVHLETYDHVYVCICIYIYPHLAGLGVSGLGCWGCGLGFGSYVCAYVCGLLCMHRKTCMVLYVRARAWLPICLHFNLLHMCTSACHPTAKPISHQSKPCKHPPKVNKNVGQNLGTLHPKRL